MPSLVEPPPQLAQFCFTQDSASQAGLRSAQNRRERRDAKHEEKRIASENPFNARLVLINEQIAHIRKRLNESKPVLLLDGKELPVYVCADKDRAALVRALTGLLDLERDLRGIPKPKPMAPQQPGRRMALPEPTLDPQPVVSTPKPE